MGFLPSQRNRFLYLTLAFTGSVVANLSSGIAAEITNTASASGDNLTDVIDSNSTSLTADQSQLELIKTADRAAAEPGDTVVYRLSLTNTGEGAADDIVVTDNLPLGLNYIERSLTGSLSTGSSNTEAFLEDSISDRTITFTFDSLEPDQTLNIVYAAVVTPDAVRGDGRNVAQETRSNLATFALAIRPGILTDCGTVVGRVFVDENFDGEQQDGEVGLPDAVIFMDDGNRITTDELGLFSVSCVLPGSRVGTLDLTSVPGYKIAPNERFIERESQSRLVRLEPGGLVRMNFAVTPIGEGQ